VKKGRSVNPIGRVLVHSHVKTWLNVLVQMVISYHEYFNILKKVAFALFIG